jgi:hypothetical protein
MRQLLFALLFAPGLWAGSKPAAAQGGWMIDLDSLAKS